MVTADLKFLMLANAIAAGFKGHPPLFIATKVMCASGWENNHKKHKMESIQVGRDLISIQQLIKKYPTDSLTPKAIEWYKDNINSI